VAQINKTTAGIMLAAVIGGGTIGAIGAAAMGARTMGMRTTPRAAPPPTARAPRTSWAGTPDGTFRPPAPLRTQTPPRTAAQLPSGVVAAGFLSAIPCFPICR
jgi:hypothetical protein